MASLTCKVCTALTVVISGATPTHCPDCNAPLPSISDQIAAEYKKYEDYQAIEDLLRQTGDKLKDLCPELAAQLLSAGTYICFNASQKYYNNVLKLEKLGKS